MGLHVLFVCTGNICRSPLAERLAVAYASRFNVPNFKATSAGTGAVTGQAIHPEAARVLQNLGGDPSNFVARQITANLALGADLILTMTTAHRDFVLQLAPTRLRRTFTFIEAVRIITKCDAQGIDDLAVLRPHIKGESLDVADPIGRTMEFHAAIGAQIAEAIPPILELCRRSPC
ncbi:low molecular weight phosphatase family protein [Mycolicibacterium elephantis]|uniref:arsenate reductase/protein-tyrosine-phosphatase family protein n=1 Tax=Mycolicibacterium elephantis TaxID=81858 RepID=UPI002E12CDC4